MTVGALHDARSIDCSLQRALQNSFSYVMALFLAAPRIDGNSRGWKHILPSPFLRGVGKFSAQRKRQMHTAESIFEILFVARFHLAQVPLQWFRQIDWQHRYPIFASLGVAHHDLSEFKVDVLHPQPHTLH